QVALIVFEDERHIVDRNVLDGEVVGQVFETFNVLLHFFPLRIGDEDDSIDAAQNELAGGVVNHLAGNGVELELGDEAFDHDRIERQKIEKERAVGGGGERDEVAPVLRINALVNVTEVGCFAAECRTVVNDLELDLAAGVVNDRHEQAPIRNKCVKVAR